MLSKEVRIEWRKSLREGRQDMDRDFVISLMDRLFDTIDEIEARLGEIREVVRVQCFDALELVDRLLADMEGGKG